MKNKLPCFAFLYFNPIWNFHTCMEGKHAGVLAGDYLQLIDSYLNVWKFYLLKGASATAASGGNNTRRLSTENRSRTNTTVPEFYQEKHSNHSKPK